MYTDIQQLYNIARLRVRILQQVDMYFAGTRKTRGRSPHDSVSDSLQPRFNVTIAVMLCTRTAPTTESVVQTCALPRALRTRL